MDTLSQSSERLDLDMYRKVMIRRSTKIGDDTCYNYVVNFASHVRCDVPAAFFPGAPSSGGPIEHRRDPAGRCDDATPAIGVNVVASRGAGACPCSQLQVG